MLLAPGLGNNRRTMTANATTSSNHKASVSGKIVSQSRAKKITVLKFKKGNQYKISRGHRQNYTAVQVGDIKL